MYTFNRDRRKIEPKEFLFYSASILFFIAAILFYIWPYVNILDINYEFERLHKERARLMQNNNLLKIEMASLKSLDKVEETAYSRLGLIFPQDGQVVIVKAE
jgi:cell division protein FtsL